MLAAALWGQSVSDGVELAEPVINLGSRLRAVRLRSGMSLREVARQLGVSPSFVSQVENGKSQPSVATLYSFAQLFDVSLDRLFIDDDVAVVARLKRPSPPTPSSGEATAPSRRRPRSPSRAARWEAPPMLGRKTTFGLDCR